MLYIGADHNGYWLKEELKSYLQRNKITVKDCGAFKHKKDDDFPDYAVAVGRSLKGEDLGILICRTGHGMAIAANKLKGIRAALATSVYLATKAREEDFANILVLSSEETSVDRAKRIVAAFLRAKPQRIERRLRRLAKIKRLER